MMIFCAYGEFFPAASTIRVQGGLVDADGALIEQSSVDDIAQTKEKIQRLSIRTDCQRRFIFFCFEEGQIPVDGLRQGRGSSTLLTAGCTSRRRRGVLFHRFYYLT